MIICGIKVTHDAAVAAIEDGNLLFSVEIEKCENNKRYSRLEQFEMVTSILRSQGLDRKDVENFVLDGWGTEFRPLPSVATTLGGRSIVFPVAAYLPAAHEKDALARNWFEGPPDSILANGYSSYSHASGHVLAAYATSPFADRGESALVLAWDGGMLPHLYEVRSDPPSIKQHGPLFPLSGGMFAGFCCRLDPFIIDERNMSAEDVWQFRQGVAGKAMAYAGLGADIRETYDVFGRAIDALEGATVYSPFDVGKHIVSRRVELFAGLSNADLIASFQGYLGYRLVNAMLRKLQTRPHLPRNLCVTGGCGLNIKWNSLLRDCGAFTSVWVPPFANDSGAALGAACCEMVHRGRPPKLNWNVYSGPMASASGLPGGWSRRNCSAGDLGRLLHETGEPVVVLDGRAELGPRALGNRSILAPAVSHKMQLRLNKIKGRESYRPIAPICLERRAVDVFTPGGHDPYMLFDHRVRSGWRDRVPAVVHLDGTARLQTVSPEVSGTRIFEILSAYEQASGIPLLCNTSANFNGRGFFPDLASAAAWGGCDYIWSSDTLFRNEAADAADGTFVLSPFHHPAPVSTV